MGSFDRLQSVMWILRGVRRGLRHPLCRDYGIRLKTAFSRGRACPDAEISLKPYHNIKIDINSGLLVDYVRQKKACAVVRGLRSESDFRFEAEMAAANRLLYSDYETIMLPCSANLGFTSSSIVREVAAYGRIYPGWCRLRCGIILPTPENIRCKEGAMTIISMLCRNRGR